MRNPQTPLAQTEEAALEHLRQDYEPVSDSFSRNTAVRKLGEIDIEPDSAENVLDHLLLKGYLYAVDDDLHITT